MNLKKKIFFGIIFMFLISIHLFAEEKPYILVSNSVEDIAEKTDEMRAILTDNNFEIVGEYQPNSEMYILIFTNDLLIKNASLSDLGIYGSALRLSLTKVDNKIQVAYTNPIYWANAYRLHGDANQVRDNLKEIFGEQKDFGSEDGLTIKSLRKYHYMVGMPYFKNQDKLAKFDSYEKAIEQIEAGLLAKNGGAGKVYRIDIPNKKETIFGVSLGNDEKILNTIDKGELKHTAYLCYEMVVSDNEVFALNAKFRIALSFPDLTMTQFTKIVKAPGNIKNTLKQVCKKQ